MGRGQPKGVILSSNELPLYRSFPWYTEQLVSAALQCSECCAYERSLLFHNASPFQHHMWLCMSDYQQQYILIYQIRGYVFILIITQQ